MESKSPAADVAVANGVGPTPVTVPENKENFKKQPPDGGAPLHEVVGAEGCSDSIKQLDFDSTLPWEDPKELAAIAAYEKQEEEEHAAMLAYSPSQETRHDTTWYTRRQLRKMAGQDPDEHPELFTPNKAQKGKA